MRNTIKIGKRGKDLAIRIPKELVEKYNIKVGEVLDSKFFDSEFAALKIKREIG